ncbi:MAG: DUF2798 domain-containing protein [Rhodospirillales bacterium]|nr:DUF2798 domain-containing protein [Rhodospirillales bacterium]
MSAKPASFRLRRIPSRYAHLLLPFILTMIMTLIIAAIATLSGVGLVPEFLEIWLRAWLFSWVVAFPVMLLVLPVARRIVANLVEPPPS